MVRNKTAVIYRACAVETGNDKKAFRPAFFSKRACWRSLYNSFGQSDYDIFVIWDGEPSNLLDEIEKDVSNIQKVTFKNNQKSLIYCYEMAEALKYSAFYFVEDDYLHTKDAGQILKEGLKRLHFVTLYDHPDRYTIGQTDYSYGQEHVFLTDTCHWRTAESTTCTVGLTKEVFNFAKKEFVDFCNSGNGAPDDRGFYRKMLTKGLRLFSPIPGRSTHCVSAFLSPFVDWKTVNDSNL